MTVNELLSISKTNVKLFLEPIHTTNVTRIIDRLSDIPDTVMNSNITDIVGNDYKQLVVRTDGHFVSTYTVSISDKEMRKIS